MIKPRSQLHNASSLHPQLLSTTQLFLHKLLNLLKTVTKSCFFFFKESRAAVWGLVEQCECIRDSQLTNTETQTRSLTLKPSCSRVGVWVADFHTPSQLPGEEKQRGFTYDWCRITQTQRGHATGLASVVECFLSQGQCSTFTSSDNVPFCQHWTSFSSYQSNRQSAKIYWQILVY